MDKIRHLNIQFSHISHAASDMRYCEALALNVMIKAKYVNSIISDYSLRKLQKMFHIKFSTIQGAVRYGINKGLLKEITRIDKHGVTHKNLKAMPIMARGHFSIVMRICDSKHGKQIFMESNARKNSERYSKAKSYQSLKDVMDMIWLAKIMCIIGHYTKEYNSEIVKMHKEMHVQLKHFSQCSYGAMCKHARRAKNHVGGKPTYLNTGISHDKICSLFKGNLSIYKIKKLIKLGQKDKLFKTMKQYIRVSRLSDIPVSSNVSAAPKSKSIADIFRYAVETETHRLSAFQERYTVRDKEGNVIKNLLDKQYSGRGTNSGETFVRMANSYFLYASVIGGRKRNYKTKTA